MADMKHKFMVGDIVQFVDSSRFGFQFFIIRELNLNNPPWQYRLKPLTPRRHIAEPYRTYILVRGHEIKHSERKAHKIQAVKRRIDDV